MPLKKSSRTIRIRGLSADLLLDDFRSEACRLNKAAGESKKTGLLSRGTSTASDPECSLALQGDAKTGTVTFASTDVKGKAIKEATDGEVDDNFDGLTVLHTADKVDLDVCAVHGLGGNGFDTWMGTTKMWLKDLLPKSTPFNASRIMTFGYNSAMFDKKSNDRIRDWADELLRQIGYVRVSDEEQKRPIIFICHSLGGLVGREAMVRLNTQPAKFSGIRLEDCGILFLSTPHQGSTQADWNEFLVSLSELTFGVRSHTIVDELRSFNPSSVDSQEAFTTMRVLPPFRCLCESNKTVAAGKSRTIVTQASAGFCGRTADKVSNVDHHTISKFDTKFGGYMPVLDQLKKIREALLEGAGRAPAVIEEPPNFPGRPSITAPHYPLNQGFMWYEGPDLRGTSQLVGRGVTLKTITDTVKEGETSLPRFIALTGIGGIGKTEILLEIALQFKNIANIFFIHAHDGKSLESSFLELADDVGHDLLSTRYPSTDLAAIWRDFGPTQRIRAFKAWLAEPKNQPLLFIVDDLDSLKHEIAIKAALPREARLILYSTRDPSIVGNLEGDHQEHRVSTMDVDEMASLMTMVLNRSGTTFSVAKISETDLEAIAKVIDGHALAACRAVSFILNVLSHIVADAPAKEFVAMFQGPDWKARSRFLHYRPRFGLSIMETFVLSLDRLRRHQVAVPRFLELLAFISSKDHSLDFRRFLRVERPWLDDLRSHLPDYEIFAAGPFEQGEYLTELENVSMGFREASNTPLRLHPLWLECIRQRAGPEGRQRWLRQILLLCCWPSGQDGSMSQDVGVLQPFVVNAFEIAEAFQIGRSEIVTSSLGLVEGKDHQIQQRRTF